MEVRICLPVLCVPAPVDHVDLDRSGNDELELASVKNGKKSWIDDLIKSPNQSFGLSGYPSLQPPFDDAFNVILENRY